jgi:N-methylhydantoinase A
MNPRDFHLVAFGGAGPLHAVAVAEELGMPGVVVPILAGVLSALGLGLSDLRFDFSRSILTPIDALSAESLADLTAQMLRDCPYQPERVDGRCDMRYHGQSFELAVPFSGGEHPSILRERFHDAHERLYGFRVDDAPVEVVTVRVGAIKPVQSVRLDGHGLADAKPRAATRPVWCGGQALAASVLELTDEGSGLRSPVRGPAVIQLPTATCLVPPGWTVRQPAAVALLIERR